MRGWWIASGASAGGAHFDDSATTWRVFNTAVKSRILLLELTQFEFARIIPSTFRQEGKAAGGSAYVTHNSVIYKPMSCMRFQLKMPLLRFAA
jgi:hypothetical protein